MHAEATIVAIVRMHSVVCIKVHASYKSMHVVNTVVVCHEGKGCQSYTAKLVIFHIK